jgi:hypothetical protein
VQNLDKEFCENLTVQLTMEVLRWCYMSLHNFEVCMAMLSWGWCL